MQAVSVLRDFTAELQGVLKEQPRHWQMKLRQQMTFIWISPLGVLEVNHAGLITLRNRFRWGFWYLELQNPCLLGMKGVLIKMSLPIHIIRIQTKELLLFWSKYPLQKTLPHLILCCIWRLDQECLWISMGRREGFEPHGNSWKEKEPGSPVLTRYLSPEMPSLQCQLRSFPHPQITYYNFYT